MLDVVWPRRAHARCDFHRVCVVAQWGCVGRVSVFGGTARFQAARLIEGGHICVRTFCLRVGCVEVMRWVRICTPHAELHFNFARRRCTFVVDSTAHVERAFRSRMVFVRGWVWFALCSCVGCFLCPCVLCFVFVRGVMWPRFHVSLFWKFAPFPFDFDSFSVEACHSPPRAVLFGFVDVLH